MQPHHHIHSPRAAKRRVHRLPKTMFGGWRGRRPFGGQLHGFDRRVLNQHREQPDRARERWSVQAE